MLPVPKAWTEVKSWQGDFLHSKVILHTSTLSEGAEQTKKFKKKIKKKKLSRKHQYGLAGFHQPKLFASPGLALQPSSPPVARKGSASAPSPPEKPLPVKNHKKNYWECLRPEKSKTRAASTQKSASSTLSALQDQDPQFHIYLEPGENALTTP